MRLLRGGDVPERRAAKARNLAELALRFQRANVYAWALWRDALATEGNLEAAEFLGWETMRRFPEDPQWRTQLALLLADQLGRPQEAESLLREAVKLFPDHVVVHTQLALLLAERLDGPPEAKSLLREAVTLFPDNIVAPTQLANIIGRDPHRLKEAIAILDSALAKEPTDRIAQNMKLRFERGQTSAPPRYSARAVSTPSASSTSDANLPVDVVNSARARRALFRVQTAAPDKREAAKREIEAMLYEDENLAYTRYVAAAAEVIEVAVDDTVIAVAYLAAARNDSNDALRAFNSRVQGLDGIVINLASASRGDEEAATRLKTWMAEPANDFSPRDHGLRAIGKRVSPPLPVNFVGDMLAASLGAVLAA